MIGVWNAAAVVLTLSLPLPTPPAPLQLSAPTVTLDQTKIMPTVGVIVGAKPTK